MVIVGLFYFLVVSLGVEDILGDKGFFRFVFNLFVVSLYVFNFGFLRFGEKIVFLFC